MSSQPPANNPNAPRTALPRFEFARSFEEPVMEALSCLTVSEKEKFIALFSLMRDQVQSHADDLAKTVISNSYGQAEGLREGVDTTLSFIARLASLGEFPPRE